VETTTFLASACVLALQAIHRCPSPPLTHASAGSPQGAASKPYKTTSSPLLVFSCFLYIQNYLLVGTIPFDPTEKEFMFIVQVKKEVHLLIYRGSLKM
jgi:hypothetical protein